MCASFVDRLGELGIVTATEDGTFSDADVHRVVATIAVGRRTGDVGQPPAHAGVAVGPVIFQDGDYYGRTVNLAARLAGLAKPGQTLVDAEVVRLAGDLDGVGFRGLGEFPLKGMVAAVAVYEALPR